MTRSNVLASVCPSVCPVGILTGTHQWAACDAASIDFGPTIRTDILVLLGLKYSCVYILYSPKVTYVPPFPLKNVSLSALNKQTCYVLLTYNTFVYKKPTQHCDKSNMCVIILGCII